MGKQDETSSFICYNCQEKNYFDKKDYINSESSESGKSGARVKEVSIQCKSCREMNNVVIEY